MARSVVTAMTLVTEDGVPIDAAHLPGLQSSSLDGSDRRVGDGRLDGDGRREPFDEAGGDLLGKATSGGQRVGGDLLGEAKGDLAIVVAHGFTLSWQRSSVWRIANRLTKVAGVVVFDFRGHGRSGGLSTLGDREIKDLDVAVAWARQLGYRRIVAVGFSMGASVVLRYAGLIGGLDAVVSVSGPGRWFYRGTERMRRVHLGVEHRLGRFITRRWFKTRVSPKRWKPVPVPPAEAAAKIAPTPLLIVHGDKDLYFPPEHARQLYLAANEPKELWLIPGMGHAETATSNDLADKIARWIVDATEGAGRPDAESSAAPSAAVLAAEES